MKLFYNANLYHRDEHAFLTEEGSFLKFGSFEELSAEYPSAEKCDLQGKYVYPGFNDSHMHILNLGQFLSISSLYEHTFSIADLQNFLKSECEKAAPGAWVKGRGFNQDYFEEKRMLTRKDLDEISTEHPIFLTRACGHIAVLNSRAIEELHLEDMEQVEGGYFDLETGVFKENALAAASERMKKPDIEKLKAFFVKAMAKANSFGITSVQSDDFETFSGIGYKEVIRALEELENEGRMTVRINQQCQLPTVEKLKDFIADGYANKVIGEHVKMGPLKLLGDGSLGARTAYLSRPYKDDPSTCGIPVFTQEQFDELIYTAHEAGMSVAIHSIGDGCLEMILNAYEKALKKLPRKDHRHGVVHVQCTTRDQLERIRDLELVCYVQTIFIDYDSKIVGNLLSDDLLKSSYNFKSLMDMGVKVSNGSDCPVEMCDVVRGMECGVTRCSIGSDVPYLEEEAMSIEEAIDSYTINGAYMSFEENKKGLLKEGYIADFAVLDQDLLKTQKNRIHEVKTLETYLSGKKVF